MTGYATGDVLRSESGAYAKIHQRVACDPRWKVPGYLVEFPNSGTGLAVFMTDRELRHYRKVTVGGDWEVAPRTGGALEERHVFTGGIIRRELRRVESVEVSS